MRRPSVITAGVLGIVAVLAATACRIGPGATYKGDGTYYNGDGSGNCSFPAGITMYAAMNHVDYAGSFACGAYVQVTGPDGTVTVQIVDQCPECPAHDLDLSPQAFDLIADLPDGRVPISWKIVSGPASIGNLQFVVKDGSNPWWIGVQVRHHVNLITKLEANVGGTWQNIPRESYNYFVASSGLGNGPFSFRVTDVYGQQVVQSGITLSPTAVQGSAVQFTRH